jgi:integrase
LAGTGFFTPEGLIRASADDKVLAWEDIQLDRHLIHVRPEVSKATGRRRRERHVQLEENKKLLKWLQQEICDNQLSGEILPMSVENFRDRLNKVHVMAGVEAKPDALRHSAISYYLAMNAGTTVRQVAQWADNSEATILKHYLQVLRKEQSEQWFAAVDQLIRA